MRLIKDVMYDAEPEKVTVYPTSVVVVKTCKEVEVRDEQSKETQTKFQCDVEMYDVSEYIDMIQKDNSSLNQQVTDCQVALAEVYELVLGGMA